MKPMDLTETRLLLVDDEPIALKTLATGLEKLGYKVFAYDIPQAALDHYRQETPDLVILDYRMPGMDGLQLARAMIELSHCPIIMLSAHNDLPLVREAIDVGVSSYLVKPVEAAHLAPSIEAALARFSEISALLKQGTNLQAGVETQRLISTAIGIVIANTHHSPDLAFESLRRLARSQRRSVRDLAFDLVDSVATTNSILANLKDIE
jgi:response regulator NasT